MVRFVPPCVLLREEKVHGGMIEKGVRVCGGGWMEDVVGVGGVHVYKECILGTVDVCVRGARCAVDGDVLIGVYIVYVYVQYILECAMNVVEMDQ